MIEHINTLTSELQSLHDETLAACRLPGTDTVPDAGDQAEIDRLAVMLRLAKFVQQYLQAAG